MIIFTLHLTISPEIKDEVLSIIHSLIGPTEAYPSCIRCRLYDDTGNNNEILFLEEWESEEEGIKHTTGNFECRKLMRIFQRNSTTLNSLNKDSAGSDMSSINNHL